MFTLVNFAVLPQAIIMSKVVLIDGHHQSTSALADFARRELLVSQMYNE